MTFGRWLRKQREECCLSLRVFARAADLSPTYVSYVENGRSKPSEKLALAAHSILACDKDEALARAGLFEKELETRLLQHPERWEQLRKLLRRC